MCFSGTKPRFAPIASCTKSRAEKQGSKSHALSPGALSAERLQAAGEGQPQKDARLALQGFTLKQTLCIHHYQRHPVPAGSHCSGYTPTNGFGDPQGATNLLGPCLCRGNPRPPSRCLLGSDSRSQHHTMPCSTPKRPLLASLGAVWVPPIVWPRKPPRTLGASVTREGDSSPASASSPSLCSCPSPTAPQSQGPAGFHLSGHTGPSTRRATACFGLCGRAKRGEGRAGGGRGPGRGWYLRGAPRGERWAPSMCSPRLGEAEARGEQGRGPPRRVPTER